MSSSHPIIAAVQQDVTMRWLTVGLCLPLCVIGVWALFVPRHYQRTLLGMLARFPDQERAAPFVKFLNGRYFAVLLRLWSLFAIGMAVALFRTVI